MIVMHDALEEILREDLPQDAKIYRQETTSRVYTMVEIWRPKMRPVPSKFEIWVGKEQIVVHKMIWPNTVTGPSYCFEIANPGVWKQLCDFLLKESGL